MKGPRRFRLLSDEEIALWRAVAETVVPRPGRSVPAAPAPLPPPIPPDIPRPRSMMPTYSPPVSQPRQALPPLAELERRYRQRVMRGRIEIDRVLDLHGLNQAEAHGALRGFLRAAQRDGAALVLVVTGKGGRHRLPGLGHDDGGVLRRAVPHWLREPDLRTVVLGFEEASRPHGGAGALYIRLRRRPDGY